MQVSLFCRLEPTTAKDATGAQIRRLLGHCKEGVSLPAQLAADADAAAVVWWALESDA